MRHRFRHHGRNRIHRQTTFHPHQQHHPQLILLVYILNHAIKSLSKKSSHED